MMLLSFARRVIFETDKRLLWKFVWNCGFKGMRSVQQFKKRLRRGEYFPPFLFISITNSCQLRCQGCWVDVDKPRRMIEPADLDRVLNEAKVHGNRFFGILGGEPLLYPGLIDLLRRHRDCYFQVFTNGHRLDDEMARDLARVGNVTPLISVEGSETISDERRGRDDVFSRTLTGLENCRRHRLITGVATSVCQNNVDDLVSEKWLRRLIDLGVFYAWFYTYRPVGPKPRPDLALRPEQALAVRRFIVEMRSKLPIAIIDAYWDHEGQALCPAATGVSHHIGPGGDIEPCPIIQLAAETIHDAGGIYQSLTRSAFLADFRRTAAQTTRGCLVLERPDLLKELALRHQARDTTQRGTALAELDAMASRPSQHQPGMEVPERHWAYRFAKKHWFFGFGAYS